MSISGLGINFCRARDQLLEPTVVARRDRGIGIYARRHGPRRPPIGDRRGPEGHIWASTVYDYLGSTLTYSPGAAAGERGREGRDGADGRRRGGIRDQATRLQVQEERDAVFRPPRGLTRSSAPLLPRAHHSRRRAPTLRWRTHASPTRRRALHVEPGPLLPRAPRLGESAAPKASPPRSCARTPHVERATPRRLPRRRARRAAAAARGRTPRGSGATRRTCVDIKQ